MAKKQISHKMNFINEFWIVILKCDNVVVVISRSLRDGGTARTTIQLYTVNLTRLG